MWTKFGFDQNSMVKVLNDSEKKETLASAHIVERLEKHARKVQALAPKSDDFLYFTIIFLKSAEASLIDEKGDLKKVGRENAWGYFDENFKWHGNVKPHKNNNGDIFPESELKIAARKWIGMPLCVDHKSDSVDGVRGIILDTYYDERLKQVVGLCALDKVNYPDLARKVATGVVRFGSMGTAVETSICTECQNKAKTAREYCDHILRRAAWGEINVGLKPMEYSLVVQPAEPGAMLLRCFASIKNHEEELKSYGVDNLDGLLNKLSIEQAETLDRVLNSVCGENGCSIDQRKGVVTAFLDHNNLTHMVKNASLTAEQEREVEFAEALAELKSATGKTPDDAPELFEPIFKAFGREIGRDYSQTGETVTSDGATAGDPQEPATINSPKDSEDTPDYTSSGGDASLLAGVTEPSESFGETGGVGPESYAFASNNQSIKTLREEIMNESRLRKRAELRRRTAYHQGGAEGVEPSGTYKDEGQRQEQIRDNEDKQMNLNPTNLGGADGMVPGDKETKEKLKRAEDAKRNMQKRVAYYYGGAEGVEPSVYKSEDYHKYWENDKQMHQNPSSLGGTDGMFPGDKEKKDHLKRASNGYRTKLTVVRGLDGRINKKASKFEVFEGDNLVIATTAGTIYGPKLEDNWQFLTSKEYGKRVVAEIKDKGLDYVGRVLAKTAQEMPAAAPAAAPAAEPAMPEMGPDAPDMDLGGMDEELPGADDMGLDEAEDPKASIEEAFMAIEEALDSARNALEELGGGDIDVNVNVGETGAEAEEIALARQILENLKVAVADADQSADELALLSDTYDHYKRLTAKQKKDLNKIASSALKDSAEIIGETKALLKMASTVVTASAKTIEHKDFGYEDVKSKRIVSAAPSDEDMLVAEAMELRKRRREAILKKAMDMADDDESHAEDKMDHADDENAAHDGIGVHPTKSGVTSDTAEDVARRDATGNYGTGSAGNADVHGDAQYSGTPARQVAEKSMADDHANAAKDDMSKDDVEEIAEEEVEEHEKEMHDKDDESDAKDKMSPVEAKLSQSFAAKKASEEREAYRVKLRRAYDVAMEMQRKGMIAHTKTAIDRQVDEIMSFDDKAFEAFKRSVANMKPVENIKTASDTSINVGVNDDGMEVERGSLTDQLTKLWS